MSKLIVEMEMPQTCAECPMGDDESRFCNAAKKYIPMLSTPSWCPIVGVLPDEHGDLIDRQDAIKEFEPYAEYESNRRNADWVKRIKAVLNSMTAVIAAERKDDD